MSSIGIVMKPWMPPSYRHRTVTTRAVTSDHDALRVAAKDGSVVGGPLSHRVYILGGRGPHMLWSQPVVDRNNNGRKQIREAAPQPVVAVQIAEHKPAAVGVHQHR